MMKETIEKELAALTKSASDSDALAPIAGYLLLAGAVYQAALYIGERIDAASAQDRDLRLKGWSR